MDATTFLQKIRYQITKDRLPSAFQTLDDFIKDLGLSELSNELAAIEARFHALERKNRFGSISGDDYTLHKNQIRDSLLQFVQELPSDIEARKNIPFESYLTHPRKKFSSFSILGFITIFLSIIILSVLSYQGRLNWSLGSRILKNPGKISHWNKFQDHIYYYNAPFTNTDQTHIDFKRNFLKTFQRNDGYKVFKILFIKHPQGNEAFQIKMTKLKESLQAIVRQDSAMRKIVMENVEVKIREVDKMPAISFFLTELHSSKRAVLIYFSSEEMKEESFNPKINDISYGLLLQGDQANFLDFSYTSLNKHFNESWAQTDITVPIHTLLE